MSLPYNLLTLGSLISPYVESLKFLWLVPYYRMLYPYEVSLNAHDLIVSVSSQTLWFDKEPPLSLLYNPS